MKTQRLIVIAAVLLIGCSSDPDAAQDASGMSDDVATTASDMASSPDSSSVPDLETPEGGYRFVRIDDDTPMGQGLALDAVEICNQIGQSCVALDQVAASSDEMLDYSGATNGANAQDATCDETSFTRLGGMGSWVVLGFADAEASFDAPSKLNVWVGWSDCPLIAAGDKPYRISIGADPAGEFVELDACLGTCTVDVP